MNEGFIQLVKDMRAAQVAYFKTRASGDLTESKRLEKLADAALKAGDVPAGHGYKQGSLFEPATGAGPYGEGEQACRT